MPMPAELNKIRVLLPHIRGLLAVVVVILSSTASFGQSIYDELRLPPSPYPDPPLMVALPPVEDKDGNLLRAEVALPSIEALINASYLARVAVFGDDVRMAGFAKGNFLPSAIPVAGQPFYNSGTRTNVKGDGSAVRLNGYSPPQSGVRMSAHTQFLVENFGFQSIDGNTGSNIAISQAYARFDRLSLGLMETAFCDPAAVPETLDLPGPNARTTIAPGGLGQGQGRISYDFLSDGFEGGLLGTVSVEQPQPHINTTSSTGTYAYYPDIIGAVQYVEGEYIEKRFTEIWHLQFSSVVRSLALENDTNTFDDEVTGWGTSLSGAYRFAFDPYLESLDRVMFSVTYGEGISHYITDLNSAPDAGDAVVNTAGQLVALPALAWYVGYTHNWTDFLRGTATYSHVMLDSTTPLVTTTSPYRSGEYLAVNLVYHAPLLISTGMQDDAKKQNFYTGLEFLLGEKETLDGARGDAHRLMWVTAISK